MRYPTFALNLTSLIVVFYSARNRNIATRNCSEVTAFIKSVDKNGDGMLQESEFVSFVARATERDSSFNGFMDKVSNAPIE